MSNIKTSPDEWKTARSLFESGKLLRQISDQTGISIPSISKKAKSESWKKKGVATESMPVFSQDDGVKKQVKLLAGFGLADEEIAAVVDVPLVELRTVYEKELGKANPEMVARVAQSMFRMATDPSKPNVTAAIFWLKCRAGWNDDPANAKIGKKEVKQNAAQNAALGKFAAPPAPPRLASVK